MAENLPRVGSALLVRDEANRILLGQRNKDPQRGAWVIPGGKIHAFESIAQAAAREIEEETGLKVEVLSQFGVYEIINPPSEHRIVIYSWGKVVGGPLQPRASDDLSEVKLFSLRELGEVPTTPLVRRVLQDAGYIVGDAEPLPPPDVQLNLFGEALGMADHIRQGGVRATADKDGTEEELAAVSLKRAQLSLFGGAPGIERKGERGFQGALAALMQTLGGWLGTGVRGLLGEGHVRRLPIPIGGASADSPCPRPLPRAPAKSRKKFVNNTPLLFELQDAT